MRKLPLFQLGTGKKGNIVKEPAPTIGVLLHRKTDYFVAVDIKINVLDEYLLRSDIDIEEITPSVAQKDVIYNIHGLVGTKVVVSRDGESFNPSADVFG